jgi:hypothetical protein
MKFSDTLRIAAVAAIGFGCVVVANADPITSLFNTGVGANGAVLSNGDIDPHYTLISSPGYDFNGSVRVATSSNGYPIGPWLGDDSSSAWIGPISDSYLDGPSGWYFYQTTFSLTGLDPATASITGQWSTDNEGIEILINGINTGTPADYAQFGGWESFHISSGFQAGVNTIDFIVNNDGGPTGLRVEMSGVADASSVPDSGLTAVMLFGSLLGLAMLRRKLGHA